MENPRFQGQKITLQIYRINFQPPGVQGLNSSTDNNQVLKEFSINSQTHHSCGEGWEQTIPAYLYLFKQHIGFNVLVGEHESVLFNINL